VVAYDERTALVVVDLQNDFADPAGNLYVRGAGEIVPLLNGEIARAGAAGTTVVCTLDWHPPETPHFARDGGIWPVHCVRDTWGARPVPGLRAGEALVVRKGTGGEDGYSAFNWRDPRTGAKGRTTLEELLRARGIRRVAIAGIATDYCVRESVLDAVALGFEAVVLVDAVRAVELRPGDGERALRDVERAGGRLERSGS